MSKGRIGWIEWARALGACGVVLLHVFVSTSLAEELLVDRAVAYDVLGIVFGRWAVPGFFMITGLLLLDPAREVGWPQVRRYAVRMACVLATFGFAFSLLEELWAWMHGAGAWYLVPVRAALDVLSATSWDHLWYVYALMVAYLLVPGLRALQERLGSKGFCLFTLVLVAVVLVAPTLVGLLTVLGGGEVVVNAQGLTGLPLNVAAGTACLCVGGCLRFMSLRAPWLACGLGSLAAMLSISVWGILTGRGDCGFVFLQGSCFACGYAVLVLQALQKMVGKRQVMPESVVGRLAKNSFGIYVIHPLLVHVVVLGLGPQALPSPVFELGLFAFALLGSMLLTSVIRRVPFVGGLL